MTITNTNYQTSYVGDGNTAIFSFAWTITETSMVEVFVNNVLQNSGYMTAISLVGSGGTVAFGPTPALGAVILIQRNSNLLQEDQLFDNSPLPATTVNAMIDKATIQIQQLQVQLNNSIQIANTLTGFTTILPTPVAGTVLGWDSTGLIITQYTFAQVIAGVPNTGLGNVTGPASSTAGHVAAFGNTIGQLLEDTGIPYTDLYSSINPQPIPVTSGFGGTGSDGAIVISTNTTYTGPIQKNATSFTVNTGVTLTINGGPFILNATGTVTIDGTVTMTAGGGPAGGQTATSTGVSAVGNPGAGLGAGQNAQSAVLNDVGGGGGGFGGAGGGGGLSGYNSSIQTGGGSTYPPSITGGSGGASGSPGGTSGYTGGAGGAGGGSILVCAIGAISCPTGSVINNLGAAGGTGTTLGGGGGGGSGGLVLLASQTSVTVAGTINATGGAGGAGTGSGAGGGGGGGSGQIMLWSPANTTAGSTLTMNGGTGGTHTGTATSGANGGTATAISVIGKANLPLLLG